MSQYLDALEPRLLELGFESARGQRGEAKSGILSLRVPAGIQVMDLHAAIDPEVVCRSTPDGFLRFAPHWPNAHSEVDGVVAELERALSCVAQQDPP